MRRIEIVIGKDGTMKATTEGFPEMSCLDEIKKLARLAGLDLKAEQILEKRDSEKTNGEVAIEH